MNNLLFSKTLITLALMLSFSTAHAANRVIVIPIPGGGLVPDAEIDSAGVIHLAYVNENNLYYVKSADNGKTFSSAVRVNSEKDNVSGGAFRGPDLALGRGGRVHVIWYDDAYSQGLPKERWGVHYAHLDPGTKAFSGERNLNRRPSDNYSLAADRSGEVVVFWTGGGLFANFSFDGGETFADAEQISPETVDPCECCATRAFFSRAGNLYCAYREKGENLRDMYILSRSPNEAGGKEKKFSRSRASVETWKVNACPMTGTFLGEDFENNILLAWATKGRINFGRHDRAGMHLPPGRVQAAERGKYPLVLGAPDGSLLVAWKKGKTLEWKLYGRINDSEPEAGATPADNSHRSAGVVGREGNYLLFP